VVSFFPFDPHQPQWFVLFVRSNQEKTTAARLADFQIEHLLPCFRSLRQWKDRRVTLDMPLFPGYVFVHLPFSERLRVLTLPNVLCLVGSRQCPSVITEEEINWIKRGVESGNAAPHAYLSEGERVIITSGALAGMQGILLRKLNKTRVVVSLETIGRGFAVEVDTGSVRPLETHFPVPGDRLPPPPQIPAGRPR
jgi:transcription antitermination factor NusG